jgi:hypothetical protein
MHRIFVSLCALAVAVPVLAQEQMPAPTPSSATVTTTTNSSGKTGLFSRMSRGKNNYVESAMPVTTTTSATTTTTTMEPVYNSRGKVRHYRAVQSSSSTVAPTPAPMPTPIHNPISQTSGTTSSVDHSTMSKTESTMVQPDMVQPVSEPMPKRGLLSRLGMKK